MELPRYSWTTLGRLLWRSASNRRRGLIKDPNNDDDDAEGLPPPSVQLGISLVLVLPSSCLGTICDYLENRDIYHFEATCRALSVSIIAARASQELDKHNNSNKTPTTVNDNDNNDAPPTERGPSQQEQSSDATPAAPGAETTTTSSETTAPMTSTTTTAAKKEAPLRSRSSKRVLSQLITSGKRAERDSKRRSVPFCLVASTLDCTHDDDRYRKVVSSVVNVWESVKWTSGIATTSTTATALTGKTTAASANSPNYASRMGDACITALVQQINQAHARPLHALERYIVHIATHVEQVFTSTDQADSMGLTSFVTDCIDLLADNSTPSALTDNFVPCSYKLEEITTSLESFSVNLLNAELRLKRCEGQPAASDTFDCDCNVVSALLTELMIAVHDETIHRDQPKWWTLQTRSHWLAATYFLWRSRSSPSTNVSESRSAELLGIHHVNQAIACLQRHPQQSVPTPHLGSPRRLASHWRLLSVSSLTIFRDDMQASSVVSGGRETFQQTCSEVEENWRKQEEQHGRVTKHLLLRDQDKQKLQQVGQSLFERYNVPLQSDGGKHEELLQDLLASCGNELVEAMQTSGRHSWDHRPLWEVVPSDWQQVPTVIKHPNPSILSILVTCLLASPQGTVPIARLLSRLVLSAYSQFAALLKVLDEGNENDDDEDSFSSDSMSEDGVSQRLPKNRQEVLNKMMNMAAVAEFLLDKIVAICEIELQDEEKADLRASADFIGMLASSYTFVATWCQGMTGHKTPGWCQSLDLNHFLSVCRLLRSLPSSSITDEIGKVAFVGMVQLLVEQRRFFPTVLRMGGSNRHGRSIRQRECMARAELLGAVACEIAILLDKSTAREVPPTGDVVPSPLLELLSEKKTASGGLSPPPPALAAFVESLQFFWVNFVSEAALENCVSSGRAFSEALCVPIGTAIVALCGCGATRAVLTGRPDNGPDRLGLGDFYDSDASANEFDVMAEDAPENTQEKRDKELLRRLCQAIQCISLVAEGTSEKLILSFEPKTPCDRKHGPLLPLMVNRALSLFADILLTKFGIPEESQEKRLWAVDYPFGTRTAGMLLDTTLHKVFRFLYGFTISGHWTNHAKDASTVGDESDSTYKQPETVAAVSQLYRCIRRAYSKSRRSPPKVALECVLSSLPPPGETAVRSSVKAFLFSPNLDSCSTKLIRKFTINNLNVGESYKVCADVLDTFSKDEVVEADRETLLVRKGVSAELAQGTLPNISCAVDDSKKTTEERTHSAQNERELSKKFLAVIDDLCYNDPFKCKGWVDAAECMRLKADLIADRLGYSLGFSRSSDFCISKSAKLQTDARELPDLLAHQETEHQRLSQGWAPTLGTDLAEYVTHQWCSFDSLQKCAKAVARSIKAKATTTPEVADDLYFEAHAWKEIEDHFRNDDYVQWQQAWGGLFVEALRAISTRCLCMALFLLHTKKQSDITGEGDKADAPSTHSMLSEVQEGLGVVCYTSLMASQGYGYPMHVLASHKKRDIASTARLCFEQAVQRVDNSETKAQDESQVTWDLVFMIGKVSVPQIRTVSVVLC